MFATAIRREAAAFPLRLKQTTQSRLTGVYNTRYKPKKVWPPDFSRLSEKEKFRFERKYKRRVKLATARPRWDKFMRMAQLCSITGVLVYTVLFMDWTSEKHMPNGHVPFEGKYVLERHGSFLVREAIRQTETRIKAIAQYKSCQEDLHFIARSFGTWGEIPILYDLYLYGRWEKER